MTDDQISELGRQERFARWEQFRRCGSVLAGRDPTAWLAM